MKKKKFDEWYEMRWHLKTVLDNHLVSTVDLYYDEPGKLYETMVFDLRKDGSVIWHEIYAEHTHTKWTARLAHKRAVRLYKKYERTGCTN